MKAFPGVLEECGGLPLWRPRPLKGRRLPPGLQLLVTTRNGGHSAPPFASMNLSTASGDSEDIVAQNRRHLCNVLNLDAPQLLPLHQVHGDHIVDAETTPAGTSADGSWTRTTRRVLVIGVADCVPIFVWDRNSDLLALLHAGWRGTAAGIVSKGIDLLVRQGAKRGDVEVCMGPSIGACCYEVGPEVAQHFPHDMSQRDGRTYLDLRGANRRLADEAGLPPKNIFQDPPCTACYKDHFFSYRKLGPLTGRMWALAYRTQVETPSD